jgi:hypothetical protein
MRKSLLVAMILLSIASLSIPAIAEDRPIQLALIAPVQIFPESYSITGIRLNLIYGKNASVSGLDVGLINHTTSGKSLGIGWGIVNLTDANFTGFQSGWVNFVKGDFEGLQYGFVNHAHYANGLQLGFVNHADRLKGIQIGLINIIQQGGEFPIFPIVNWSF